MANEKGLETKSKEDTCSLDNSDCDYSLPFNRNVENTGMNLCGKHAIQYQNWRIEYSPTEPDVLCFIGYNKSRH
jgi:hypothetical protein